MQTVLLPLEVILRRARGTVVLGIDRSVWYARRALPSNVVGSEQLLLKQSKAYQGGEAV